MTRAGYRNALLTTVWVLASSMMISTDQAAAQSQRAQDFVDAIGINVHIAYTDSAYANLDQVTKALDYLEIKLLRDGGPNTQTLPRYNSMAKLGFRFDFYINSGDTGIITQRLSTFDTTYPNSLEAVEGPNEVNNFPISYGGQTGTNAAIAYQAALYNAVKAAPVLSATPVYNFTDYPLHAGAADYMNLHPYPKRGAQPYATLAPDLAISAPPMPGKQRVITEMGYTEMSDPTKWAGLADWTPVNESTQAILILNALFDAYSLGAQRIYLYQLLESYNDVKNTDFDTRLGLFDFTYRPKAAATGLRNLLTVLRDSGSNAHNFPLRASPASLSNLPSTARSLTLERSDGSDIIVLWNEAKVWDSTNRVAVAVPATQVVLTPTASRSAAVYDPLQSVGPIANAAAGTPVQLSLAAHPLIVVLAPH